MDSIACMNVPVFILSLCDQFYTGMYFDFEKKNLWKKEDKFHYFSEMYVPLNGQTSHVYGTAQEQVVYEDMSGDDGAYFFNVDRNNGTIYLRNDLRTDSRFSYTVSLLAKESSSIQNSLDFVWLFVAIRHMYLG